MGKKYSTVQVHNPTSLQHIVRLHQEQDALLSFDKEQYKGLKLETPSEYLKIQKVKVDQSIDKFHYVVTPSDLTKGWSEYSACFLGEIWVDCDNTLCKIVVVLQSSGSEKAEHLTVVNPDCYDVRVLPHQVMEFVVYDMRFSHQDEWIWEWRPTLEINVEQIGYDHLSLYSWFQSIETQEDAPDYRYARYPRVEVEQNVYTRQHHFWFRFDKSVLDLEASGIEHVGNMVITGCTDRFIKGCSQESSYQASVYLDFRKPCKPKVMQTLGLKTKDDYTEFDYRHYQDYNSSKRPKVSYNKKRKGLLPETREVVINCIQMNSLDEGCKVLSAMPDEYDDLREIGCDECEYDEYRGLIQGGIGNLRIIYHGYD